MMRSNLLSNLWTMLCTPSHPYGRPKRHGDFAPVRSPRLHPAAPLPDRTNEDEQDENEEKEGGGVWVT
ncbi:hypothetical protein CE91St33_05130 [Eggerthella lenta]|nr:hypothetical protein CE91St33_05130 [Eggerthella lenta]